MASLAQISPRCNREAGVRLSRTVTAEASCAEEGEHHLFVRGRPGLQRRGHTPRCGQYDGSEQQGTQPHRGLTGSRRRERPVYQGDRAARTGGRKRE